MHVCVRSLRAHSEVEAEEAHQCQAKPTAA